MIAHESHDFICKKCGKSYRGLVKRCPHCGVELRPKVRLTNK